MTDDEQADITVAAELAAVFLRESVYRSGHLDMTAEQIVAATLIAWVAIKGGLPGRDVLDHARQIAAEYLGVAPAPADDGMAGSDRAYL